MATDWEANLQTLIKNTEKDSDFLRRVSSWKVRDERGKLKSLLDFKRGKGEQS